MPVMCELGPAVPAGLTRYASRVFGAGYRDNFFAAMFNLRKVTRHVLEPNGATYKSRDADFLVSDHRDFHPTDVIEDADGSLLVVDTGPWYKLCCPTSQLAKPEVLGAIYRVRRTGAPKPGDPRGRRLAWNTMTPAGMTTLLDDERPAVQSRALQQYGTAGPAAVPALAHVLRTSPAAAARRNAVWALVRIEGAAARAALRAALGDRDDSVRSAAIHSAGLWRDGAALPQLVAALHSGQPALQRAAAEALGRIGDAGAVPDLVAASAAPMDRVLEHSLTYAMIEIGDAPGTAAAGVQATASRAKRAALIALDQMDGGQVRPEALVPLLDSPDAILGETAWWIAGRHPEWGSALAGFFTRRLGVGGLTAEDRDGLQRKLAQFASDTTIQELLAETVVSHESIDARLTALRAMALASSSSVPAATRMKELPGAWAAALSRALAAANDDVARQAVAVARALPAGMGVLQSDLLRVARDQARTNEVRLDALTAIAGATVVDTDLFELVRTSLAPGSPASRRAAAVAVLEKIALGRSQLMLLVPALASAGPIEIPRLLPPFAKAFDKDKDEALGLAVVAALEKSTSRSTVRAEMLRPVLAGYPAPVRTAGEALLASIHVDSAKQAQRLAELLATVQGGDVARGQMVFNGAKGTCLSCHAIGYIGGTIGPDLTRIGQVRGDRDLLEAVVFPNASFARGFEPVSVRMRSGALHGGVLRSDAPDEIVLSTVAGADMRLARRDIAEIEPGAISLMPPGYGDLLTRQELADLLAFLKAAR
jgi:putative heme-binding domain-containing protein